MRRGITVIPSSVNRSHIEENYSTYKDLLNRNILTVDEVKSITNINGPDGSPTIQISFGAKKFDNSDKNYIILQYYK
jgi:diketogulonate reductase-like aldo/keto reductase